MRIVQIQPMSESAIRYATRWPVAFALACVVTAGTASVAFSTGGPGFVSGASMGTASGDAARPAPPAVRPMPADIAVRGAARVVDGDTLDVGGTRVRLEGIDAPENGQTCSRKLIGTWKCGAAATKALQEMVAGREVQCASRGADKYGRTLGICWADGIELNERMVREGHAWAFVKYSASYVEAEKDARASARGIFATDNEPAWVYRTNHWKQAEQVAPEGCAIKGNVTRNGHIYHMPWSPWYARVQVDAARGERWFCSESEAIAAGWRAAQGS